MKQIIITEKEDGTITFKANKGVKWSTFITGIEMMVEELEENCPVNIDNILEDIKRIYERDKRDRTNDK